MSASREKRSRQGTQEEILNQKLAAEAEHKAKKKKNTLIGIAVTLVVVLLIGSIVLVNGPFFLHSTVAVTTGSHELSPVQVRYYYLDSYQQMVNSGYGSILSMMYGEQTDISQVIYDDTTGQTWAEYVMETALEDIRTSYAIYDDAMANGYTLSEEGAQALKQAMDTIDLYAQMYGVSTDVYLSNIYGRGANKETYEAYQNVLAIVNEYQVTKSESYTYDEATLNATYEADPTLYKAYTYRSYLVSVNNEDGTKPEGDALTAAMEEAKATAEKMAADSEGNEQSYLASCVKVSGNEAHLDGELTLRKSVRRENMSISIREWVTDPAREAGDTAAIEYEGNGYYVVYFLGSDDNDYDAWNIRSIYINATTTDADGNSVIDFEAVQPQVDALMADVEASADLLADMDGLAMAFSDDENTYTTGGVYEYVSKASFHESVTEWLYAEGRKAGDYELIQTNNGYYFIYVEENAGNYRDYLISLDLMLDEFNVWRAEITASTAATATVVENGMKRVPTSLLTPASSDGTNTYVS